MNSSDSGSHNETLVQYWLEKSEESLDSADSDYQAGRLSPAVRSIYYACFYALSAVMLNEGKTFRKHTAIRGALHRDLIRTGKLDSYWGRYYDEFFESRHRGDYQPLVSFESEQVQEYIIRARGFVKQMENLLER